VLLCLYPTVMLVRGSLHTGRINDLGPLTLQNYIRVYSNPETYQLFTTTVWYAVSVSLVSVAVGFLLAWVAVRTNAPLAGQMSWLIFIPYALPSTLTSVAWILLANPNTGFLNQFARVFLGEDATPFNIYTLGGMVFVSSTHAFALAFAFLSAALHSMDPSLEEAARMSGATTLQIGRRVSLPLAWPAIFSMLALLVILGLESFDVPAFIGIPAKIYVFTTEVFIQTRVVTPPDYGMAAAYGALPLLLALLLTYYYQRSIIQPERYATIGGKAYRPRRIDLGRWRWLAFALFLVAFLVVAVLPLLTLAVVSLAPTLIAAKNFAVGSFSLQNYQTVLGDPIAQRAIKNTIILAVVGASAAMGVAFLVAYVTTRTKLPGRGLIEYILFLPFTFPSVVLAVGILWGYIRFPIAVYATIWILMIGYVTKFLPYGLRTMSTSFLQINRELEEAGRTSGASFGQILRRVILPLSLPGLIAGWSLLVVVFMREFSISLMLWASGSEVVTVLFYDYWTNGRFGQLGALGMLLVCFSLVIVFGVRRLARLDTVATT
jgi:iron(III) transport system permease protein